MLDESAPEDLEGSFAPSLTISKLWLCRVLKRVMRDEGISSLNQVYSLGSWYGNMALFMLLTHVPFKILIDVDKDPVPLRASQAAFDRLAQGRRIVSVCDDANRLRYFLTNPSAVINTSTNNMRNHGWLANIPRGTIVALQGRDAEPTNSLNDAQTLRDFDVMHPLRRTLFMGSLDLSDPGDSYSRFMKIGIK